LLNKAGRAIGDLPAFYSTVYFEFRMLFKPGRYLSILAISRCIGKETNILEQLKQLICRSVSEQADRKNFGAIGGCAIVNVD
jgi:hypothetical protein